MNRYNELIDELIGLRLNMKDYEDTDTLQYQRTSHTPYKGKASFSVWRVLLDDSKTVWCVRDANGFKSVKKTINDQVIHAPYNVKELILSNSMKDKEVGRIILDQIAEKKYK